MKLHWDAAPDGIRDAYEAVSEVLIDDGSWYLAGGTALALLERHRISADLDLFAPTIGDPLDLADRLGAVGMPFEVLSTARETLYVTVGGVQVSCIGSSTPLLAPLISPEPGLIPLADRDDIAAMKLAAVASRGSRKDFVDLWVLITRHRTLDAYLNRYREKYGADVGHLLRSLVYFDDAEREPALRLINPIDWDAVKSDLRTWVEQALSS